MLPDPNQLVHELDSDQVSAMVLAGVATAASDGKLTAHNLRDVVVPVGNAIGWKLCFDDLHRLAEAAVAFYQMRGGESLEVAMGAIAMGFPARVAAAVCAGVATIVSPGREHLQPVRAMIQRAGIPLDTAEYAQVFEDAKRLTH